MSTRIAFRRYARIIPMILLASCASVGASSAVAVAVQTGESKEQVLAQLGPPGDRQFRGENEALQYCRTIGNWIMGDRSGEYTVIWLYRGRVTGVSTYRVGLGTRRCEAAFTTLDWEKAPSQP